MNERMVRITHAIIMSFTLLFAIVTLGISASLVSMYNKEGNPAHHGTQYRDRIRITLVGAVWTTVFSLVLLIGFQTAGHSAAWGIITHMVPIVIGFLLTLIGASSVTALTNTVDCGNKDQTFNHCSMVKNMVVTAWIDTIFLFIGVVLLIIIAFHARAWGGARRQSLYVE